MKCDLCGAESTFEIGYKRERRSFRRSYWTLCPACWVRRRQSGGRWFLWTVPVLGIAGSALLWHDGSSELGHLFFNLFLLDLFLICSIVPHELGHAVVARMLGWRVFRVMIGIGKPAFKWQVLGFCFDFRRLPIGGATLTSPVDLRWFRLKWFLLVLAGPMANGVMVLAVFLLWQGNPRDFDFQSLPLAPRLFLLVNAWVLVANLVPFQSKSLNLPSDGRQLINALAFSKEAIEKSRCLRFVREALLCRELGDHAGAREWCNKGLAQYPEDSTLLNMGGIASLDEGKYQEAREIFLKLVAKETKPGPNRYLFLNNVAYAAALIQDPQLLPEADACSLEAYLGMGWNAAIVGTRGTVLVAMGNYTEGVKLLTESFENAETAISKAENACHLAIANARQGKPDEARRYLQLARQFDGKCRLIAWAEQEPGTGVVTAASIRQG